jgi:hypothetical protein
MKVRLALSRAYQVPQASDGRLRGLIRFETEGLRNFRETIQNSTKNLQPFQVNV